MPFDIHTVEQPKGTQLARNDRVIIGTLLGVANAAGAAGAAVNVVVTGMDLPPNYAVVVNPGQDAGWFVNAKTSAGFTVVLHPRDSTLTLAAGTIDILIVA